MKTLLPIMFLALANNACGSANTLESLGIEMNGSGKQGSNSNHQGSMNSDYDSDMNLAEMPAEIFSLSEEQKADLLYMYAEESLAKDIYSEFFTKYSVQIFTNISKSETKHAEAIKMLLTKYNIAIPELSAGKYGIDTLDALYTNLISEGNVNVEAAIAVGVKIENADIKDLDAKNLTANADAQFVFARLKSASERHLKAFTDYPNNDGCNSEKSGMMNNSKGKGKGKHQGR